ncbi:murein transglycosylase [Iodidimonas gelatinilytica]|uniref:Murein transglycosylase n=1 Tax=Iodidimonas gelatinilytica TaxID=1236966 RepID=A0A5A7N1L2_9PROT|nr:lytic murein transglycosylase [Iodidimonas gelatinilytica]GER01230.1 murein transglycosylase [Iodidimonas gelatinilytica]
MRIFASIAAFLVFASANLGAWAQSEIEAMAEKPSVPVFAEWLEGVRLEARERGISQATIDAALSDIHPNERVVELDRKQPEFTQTFEQYLEKRVSDIRIKRGREMMVKHRDSLRKVAEKYGVQPRFIAAIWGLETNYGAYTGGMNVVQSLATLAYDQRRAAFFRKQLFAALTIIDEGHIAAADMMGSWAGAMGQSQFMPTSFNAYAQDFDGDGRRDIWTTEADVFASIAYYLASHGWRGDMTWGRAVLIPAGMSPTEGDLAQTTPPKSCGRALKAHSKSLDLADWQKLGVRRLNGEALPEAPFAASMVQPGSTEGRAYLTYKNYRAILSYNCSNLYAMAVGHLADALKSAE